MTTGGKHALYSRIAVICSALLLAFLFIYPASYLKKMSGQLSVYANACMDAAMTENWPEAYTSITGMQAAFSRYDQPLRLFLDHEDIDELEGLISRSVRLTMIEEQAHLVYELESIINTLEYLEGIETFTIFNLF